MPYKNYATIVPSEVSPGVEQDIGVEVALTEAKPLVPESIKVRLELMGRIITIAVRLDPKCDFSVDYLGVAGFRIAIYTDTKATEIKEAVDRWAQQAVDADMTLIEVFNPVEL